MTDDEKQTSEDTPTEEPQAESEETPAAEETPVEGTPAAPGSEAEEAAVDGEAQPSADDDHDLTPSEEAEGPDAEAESSTEDPADAPVAEQEAADEDSEQDETAPEEPEAEAADDAPAAEEPEAKEEPEPAAEEPEAEKKTEKKKDVIPGADLEPIAVESTEERPLSAEERARREAEEEERAQREAALTGDGDDEEGAASRAPAKMESGSRYQATGKRKRSIARVTLLPGGGEFEINGRTLEEFFPRPLHQTMAKQALTTTGYETSVDVRIRVHGGGIGGQAGAVRHGISRALTEIDPELRGELKRRGFLTRDARVKERRKAGLKKARKKPQFSKR
jgi:small subunit ribosomal protein S9